MCWAGSRPDVLVVSSAKELSCLHSCSDCALELKVHCRQNPRITTGKRACVSEFKLTRNRHIEEVDLRLLACSSRVDLNWAVRADLSELDLLNFGLHVIQRQPEEHSRCVSRISFATAADLL